MKQGILTINAGSSSIKFALFELADQISKKAAISRVWTKLPARLLRTGASCRQGEATKRSTRR